MDFIKTNNHFLQIVERDGEYYVEIHEFNNPKRFVMNEHRMYIIGETVFRQFDDVLIETSIANKEELRKTDCACDLEANPSMRISRKNEPLGPVLETRSTGVHTRTYRAQCDIRGSNFRFEVSIETRFCRWGGIETGITARSYTRFLAVWWGESAEIPLVDFRYSVTNGVTPVSNGVSFFVRNAPSSGIGWWRTSWVATASSTRPWFTSYHIHARNRIVRNNGTCECVIIRSFN